MESPSNFNKEATEDLPEELQLALALFENSHSEEDLHALVIAVLSDFSDGEIPSDLSDDANFMSDLGLDSLAITEFVFFFEDVCNLKITNEELLSLTNLAALKRFLTAKLIK